MLFPTTPITLCVSPRPSSPAGQGAAAVPDIGAADVYSGFSRTARLRALPALPAAMRTRLCEGGAKRVAQRPERSAGQDEVLSRNWPGSTDSTGNPPADAAVAPGAVNRKLSVLANSSTPMALPRTEICGHSGR